MMLKIYLSILYRFVLKTYDIMTSNKEKSKSKLAEMKL